MSEKDPNVVLNADQNADVVDTDEIEAALQKNSDEADLRTVNVGCRRGKHLEGRPGASSGSNADLTNGCDSTTAYVMNDVMEGITPGQSVYRCTECGYSWSVSTGRSFNI
jgi:lipopolysaccharide biosynthesis regulator YciM